MIVGDNKLLPIGWQWHKAGNVIDVRDGTHDSPKYQSTGIPLVTSKNLVDGAIDFSTCTLISDEDHAAISKRSAVGDGDILYAMIGTIGNPVIVKKEFEFSIKNVALFKFENDNVYNRYIYHYLKSNIVQRQFSKKARGGTQKFVSLGNIRDLLIPIPPLEEQKRIAAILDKADAVRRKRLQAIDLTDQLLRSVFLDMFGDPVTNPKGWDTKTIEQLISEKKYSLKRGPFGGALKKEIFVDSGYLVYEQFHALNNDFSFQRYFIDESKFNELKAFEVKGGDIIISCSGVNLGRLAIVPKGSPQGIINQALLKLTLNEEIMLNEMFINIFTHPNFKSRFFGEQRGSGVPNFPPMSTFKEFKFITPPIDMQEEYLVRIASIQSGKTKECFALEKLENLFSSLTQQAFRGELSSQKGAA